MRTLIAVLIGALMATGAAVALVHNDTMIRQAPARVLYNYGSGLPAEAACHRLGGPPDYGSWSWRAPSSSAASSW